MISFLVKRFLTKCLIMSFYTICPRSVDPFFIVTYYIKWIKTSWTYSTGVRIYKFYLHIYYHYRHMVQVHLRYNIRLYSDTFTIVERRENNIVYIRSLSQSEHLAHVWIPELEGGHFLSVLDLLSKKIKFFTEIKLRVLLHACTWYSDSLSNKSHFVKFCIVMHKNSNERYYIIYKEYLPVKVKRRSVWYWAKLLTNCFQSKYLVDIISSHKYIRTIKTEACLNLYPCLNCSRERWKPIVPIRGMLSTVSRNI